MEPTAERSAVITISMTRRFFRKQKFDELFRRDWLIPGNLRAIRIFWKVHSEKKMNCSQRKAMFFEAETFTVSHQKNHLKSSFSSVNICFKPLYSVTLGHWKVHFRPVGEEFAMLLRFAEKFISGPFSGKIFFRFPAVFFRFGIKVQYVKLFAKYRFNE